MVEYEWDVEEVTAVDSEQYEKGEVLDHWHWDTYSDCVKFVTRHKAPEGMEYHICIVRDDDAGRSWAYLNADGTLPENFLDAFDRYAAKVPKRFHQEVAKHG